MNIFDELQAAVGCEYLSDLRMAESEGLREFFSGADLSVYSLTQLSDLAQYLFGAALGFDDHESAKNYFIEMLSA